MVDDVMMPGMGTPDRLHLWPIVDSLCHAVRLTEFSIFFAAVGFSFIADAYNRNISPRDHGGT